MCRLLKELKIITSALHVCSGDKPRRILKPIIKYEMLNIEHYKIH